MKKKIIYGILSFIFGIFFGGVISFCSAENVVCSEWSCNPSSITFDSSSISIDDFVINSCSMNENSYVYFNGNDGFFGLMFGSDCSVSLIDTNYYHPGTYNILFNVGNSDESVDFTYGVSSPSVPTITVLYNNENSSETISCDGDNIIIIDGLSTITATNKFTPYFNIDYVDEDNQSLVESYSKDILYLENGKFKKTYTGNNDWILSVQENQSSIFTGFTPVFDVTGTTDVLNTGNVFNNWSDNALKVLLSNVPGYIQYITIFAILLFLFSFLMRFKRKR